MKNDFKKGVIFRIAIIAAVLGTLIAALCIGLPISASDTLESSELLDHMMDCATSYIVVYHKQLGGSHYAYTEGLAEEYNDGNQSANGNEATFRPGSKMTLLTLTSQDGKVVKEEKTLVNCKKGVIRDPDVSKDGTKVVYSMKSNENDDYHLYIYDLTTDENKQLTFGNGQADIEPVFTSDGSIIFNSTRDTQTVDCWITPVSNMYKCDADGNNIIRLGYDQVHTTYPTTAEDGRIIYTRWDYNDRNQMYVQSVFQMFEDGTGQTELFGNDSNNPTTLLHTREIPNATGKYVAIVCGHHIYQCGKLAIIDTNEGRNGKDCISYVKPDKYTKSIQASESNDTAYYQEGRVYKYPYPISETEFLVSTCKKYSGSDTPFDIVLMNTSGKSITIAEGSSSMPASQIVPIKTTSRFNRASSVDYTESTGTYYVANVYEGQDKIEKGSVKYLRVVGLEFRSSAIGATVGRGTGSSDPYSPISTGNGAWDVKQVLGIVPVCEDGSALFTVPSETPVYFQLLDENGDVVQTMRSWSTLQPGETFSCVGCHLDKNYAPTATSTPTQAMLEGVKTLEPDLWMADCEEYDDYDPYSKDYIGFDYLSVVQPILDKNCISCHGDTESAYAEINAGILGSDDNTAAMYLVTDRDKWYYTTSKVDGSWKTDKTDENWTLAAAPFGKSGTAPDSINTRVSSGNFSLRKTVTCTQYDISSCNIALKLAYTGKIEIFVNGKSVYSGSRSMSSYEEISLSKAAGAFKVGENEIAVSITGNDDGTFFDCAVLTKPAGSDGGDAKTTNFFSTGSEWKYYTASSEKYSRTSAGSWTKTGFNDSSWKSGKTPFGNRLQNQTTDWTYDGKTYLWARKTFTVNKLSDLGENFAIYLNTYYDDTCYIYINGVQVLADTQWTDEYVKIRVSVPSGTIKEGENVIAVSLHQHEGGYEFDLGLYAVETSAESAISLESVNVLADRMKKYFPMSYLVLTQSKAEKNGSVYQWVANSTNKYTNWVSSMSQCEMLTPYQYGAHKSALITRLRSGHGGLTDSEIRAIACWIDLGVPCYGSYDSNTYWNSNDRREYDEELNKRNYYDMLDKAAKQSISGELSDKELTVTYKPATGSSVSATGKGIVTLSTSKVYKQGDKIKIKLPDGEHYVAICLSSRVGETIIYCPDSELTITLPSLDNCYPNTFKPSLGVTYSANNITARIVGEDELSEVHNLAKNQYDTASTTNVYPHATSSEVKDGKDYYSARNVIDGFCSNGGSGKYPNQSWQPKTVDENTELTIDFGRTVTVSELQIILRNADGDTHFTDCLVTFSDGSSKRILLGDSDSVITAEIGNVETTSLKFSDFNSGDSEKSAAITEIKVMGTETKAK